MKMEVPGDADAVAQRAAKIIAQEARAAVTARGRFAMAVSGGHTPWAMLRALATEDVPWRAVHVFQVDERIAPAGDPDRNLTHILESLLVESLLVESLTGASLASRTAFSETQPPEQIYAMPVEMPDKAAAAAVYAAALERVTGAPPVLDLVHLGMGPDGHTASLVPGDAVLEVRDRDVAITGPYQGRERMTLTYPVINRARRILWVITGEEKAPMLKRLLADDASIPAGRVARAQALVIADRAAASENK